MIRLGPNMKAKSSLKPNIQWLFATHLPDQSVYRSMFVSLGQARQPESDPLARHYVSLAYLLRRIKRLLKQCSHKLHLRLVLAHQSFNRFFSGFEPEYFP